MFDSLSDAKKILLKIQATFNQNVIQADPEIETIITTLVSVFDIAFEANNKKQLLNPQEISEIAEHALSLIDSLVYKLGSKNSETQQQVTQFSLTISQWLVIHKGTLSNIHIIVDALAYQANTRKKPKQLAELAHFMTQVAHACNSDIINDLDNANPSRPWRVLNLNRGIVATRSLDLDIMNSVFPELITAIPMDAPNFFKEGLTEMIRLNYPSDVAAVMQGFFDQTKMPAVH